MPSAHERPIRPRARGASVAIPDYEPFVGCAPIWACTNEGGIAYSGCCADAPPAPPSAAEFGRHPRLNVAESTGRAGGYDARTGNGHFVRAEPLVRPPRPPGEQRRVPE